jgi:predicted membrane-bound spermidine synthase
MSAGAMLVSRFSARVRDPLQGYAIIEFAVGCIGLIFHDAYQWSTSLAYDFLYPTLAGSPFLAAAKWSLASALILPQSVLLGATFPLMSAGVMRLRQQGEGRSLSLLYFANSLGAAVGVLVAGFYLVELAGLPGTLLAAAALNLVVALLTLGVAARARRAGIGAALAPEPRQVKAVAGTSVNLDALRTLLVATSFGTALASFIYEIDWIRMLSLVLGSATHAFELMLSAFILGLALGAFWIRRSVDRLRNPVRTLGLIQWTMGLAALATLPVYVASFEWMAALMATFARTDAGYTGFTIARYAICLVVMLPATFCAGMTLPIITRTLIRSGVGERAIGSVYAWNTLGSIVGVILGGLVLLPLIGLKAMLVAGASLDMGIGALLIAAGAERRTAGRRLAYALGLGAAAAGLGVMVGVELEQRLLASGVYRSGVVEPAGNGEVLFYRDGRTASVASLRTQPTGQVTLATNGKPDASLQAVWFQPCHSGGKIPLTGDAATQALIPLVTMAHMPAARSAAVIGFGSGMTSHVLLGADSLRDVVTIEIEPQMVEGARVFYPVNRRAYDDARGRLVIDDAKSYFASENRRFDIILSEPSNPWVSGVSGLFTSEFYARLRRYLTEDGVLGQWIHTYELDDALVLSVISAIHQNFRSYQIHAVAGADLLVVASNRPELPAPDWSVLQSPGAMADLCHFHPLTTATVENLRLVGRAELDPLIASVQQPNSDYYPVLDLGAERRRYIRSAAGGFLALSSDWYNLLASVTGTRQGPALDTVAALPQTPRVQARALAARARSSGGGVGSSDAVVQQVAYLTGLWKAWLAEERVPSNWPIWLNQMDQVARIHHGGQAGVPDDAFYRAAGQYAERMRAPETVRQVVAFRHALAGWDFGRAAAAADRILPVVLAERRWIPADELRDGAVLAKLHIGDVSGARQVLDTLARFSTRSPGDLRTRLLQAYVTTAEGRRSAAMRP